MPLFLRTIRYLNKKVSNLPAGLLVLAVFAGLGFLQLVEGGLNHDSFASDEKPSRVRIEVFLARGQKEQAKAIRQEFEKISLDNVHFKFFRAGRPPANISIGGEIEASTARLSIELSIKHAQGIKFLVPEPLLPATWIGIGSSAFDERNQIPVTVDDVEKLRDPSLTTEQFHELYRKLSQGGEIY